MDGMSQVDAAAMPSELAVVIERLSRAQSSTRHLELPRKTQAGVLVLLCTNEAGGVSVILTTRALTMRSFPGETALPGGRMEEDDADIAATALREAREEVGLGLDIGTDEGSEGLELVMHMPPLVSKNLLFVVPVVVACRSHTAEQLLKTLTPNAAEVGSIWMWPLRDFLYLKSHPTPSPSVWSQQTNGSSSSTSEATPVVRYAYQDVRWLMGKSFRLHHFHHARMASPVTGLTAEILLGIALLAYDVAEPGFARWADNQITGDEMVQAVLDGKAGLNGDERSSLRKGRVAEDAVAGHSAV